MQLQFIGCGDAFGSGGRFNTCFRVTASKTNFLIDCGASSLVAMRKLGIEPNSIPTIFITHLHGDHFGGLPFLLLDAQFASRRATPLTIAGPPGLKARLEAAQEVLFPGSAAIARKFKVTIVELEPGKRQMVNGVGVTPHGVQTGVGHVDERLLGLLLRLHPHLRSPTRPARGNPRLYARCARPATGPRRLFGPGPLS